MGDTLAKSGKSWFEGRFALLREFKGSKVQVRFAHSKLAGIQIPHTERVRVILSGAQRSRRIYVCSSTFNKNLKDTLGGSGLRVSPLDDAASNRQKKKQEKTALSRPKAGCLWILKK
ncbi:MAG: hypothetical protein HUK16_00950 [Bacteroidales bacterium]|nr:hypothetical protein [Bacteroidales bacterium]